MGRALEVDQDVDLELARAPGDRVEALAVQVLEALAGGDHALAHRALVVRAARQQRHLERAAVVAFEHLRHQLAGRVDVEVGREVADAQAPAVRARDAARQRPVQLGDVKRVVARHLELLERIVDQDGVRKRAGLDRRVVRQGANGGAQAGHGVVGGGPAARLALEEDELRPRRQLAAAEAEHDRGAHALGGLGLHAELLERHAEAKVRERVVHLQRQGVEERADRLLVAAAALQRDGERDVVVGVALDVGRQRAQGLDRLLGAPHAEQGVRFERVGEAGARVAGADRARAPHRIGGASGLDQGVRRRQGVGGVAMQRRRLFERARRERPVLALGVRLAGLPEAMGARVRGRGTGRRGVGEAARP